MDDLHKLTLESRVRHNSDVLLQELHGEAVLLNLDSGIYFGLDEVGTRMWRLIGESDCLADVAMAIVEEFEVGEARCTQDLLELVARLQSHDLVRIAETDQTARSS